MACFRLPYPRWGHTDLSVTVDGCQMFYADSGAVKDSEQARTVQVGSRDVSGIRFRLPKDPAALCAP